ncbi:MAG: DEAD/DEAH box helicase, partial [Nanoarchaeota archaeon]
MEAIIKDLSKPSPMNRLLQGDVGSGKTVVAAIAALVAAKVGKQTAFMAPTEVLARQHYKTLSSIFKNSGAGIGLITGSETRAFYGENLEEKIPRKKLLEDIAIGKIKIIIGTHALIAKGDTKEPVRFSDLALAIVDEQHRFGVEQRAALSGTTIHFLSMSATPIPRTLALTLFGDLDVSVIDELPSGRKEIVTKVVAPTNRSKAYDFIKEHLRQGRQAFVICPRIEAGKKEDEDGQPLGPKQLLWAEVKNVTEEYERLSKTVFPEFKLAMLHGRLKSSEKARIMADFGAGNTHILVSTSVVEVGVDVPNASIMMIEGADRFGLAQLYQFRGRVGRGEHQSYCLLFTDSGADTTVILLNALVNAKNGFELAEKDLAIRGPGE